MNSNYKIITERREGKEILNWKKFDFIKIEKRYKSHPNDVYSELR